MIRDLPLLLVLLLAACVGCGDDGKYSVKGTVTFKGDPVPAGEIRFHAQQREHRSDGVGPDQGRSVRNARRQRYCGRAISVARKRFGAAGNSKDPSAPDFGKELFRPYLEDVDFPKEDFEHNIEID